MAEIGTTPYTSIRGKRGFTQSHADPCVYVRMIDPKRCVIVIVWVDDIIIAGSHFELLTTVKESLGKRFKMKDLGEPSWFLGTEFKCKESSGKALSTC